MATPIKSATEPKVEPTTEPAGGSTDEALTEKITTIVKDVLGGITPAKTESSTEPTDTGKPMTARQQEETTHNIVQEAIKAFKTEFSGGESKSEPAKEPETKPGARSGRWIEGFLWGKE
jgi:hypothetical protein